MPRFVALWRGINGGKAKRIAMAALHALAIAPAMAQAPASIEGAAWLAGCWRADGREAGSVEHWLAPAGCAASISR